MKWSSHPIFTLRQAPAEADTESYKLLLRGGYLRKTSQGIFTYNYFFLRAQRKFEAIVRKHLHSLGASEIMMPMVHPKELWEETGRWDKFGHLLLKLKNRQGADFCLGPTHEEVIVDYVRKDLNSYRQLPFDLYQIQTKYRDEIRPRFGLLRAREFLMKDAYSFDRDKDSALESYERYKEAYHKIFQETGLDVVVVEADQGDIGGQISHEFHVLAERGEDELLVCPERKMGFNVEVAPKDRSNLKSFRGIEVGHIFNLSTVYSEPMNLKYIDKSGSHQPVEMGCYGIGITRTIQAAVEQSHDANGIIWPQALAPFDLHICLLDPGDPKACEVVGAIAADLERAGFSAFVDDREERPGIKFKDADLLGLPYRVTVGRRGLEKLQVEVVCRKTQEACEVSISDISQYLLEQIRSNF